MVKEDDGKDRTNLLNGQSRSSKMAYDLVEAGGKGIGEALIKLRGKVNEAMDGGWLPSGGVAILPPDIHSGEFLVYQAMVKKADKPQMVKGYRNIVMAIEDLGD
jgi:hypothetical protein